MVQESLLAELETAVQGSPPEKRIATLRRITDLFLKGANRFNDQQIRLFDKVLMKLIERIEAKALSELSDQLAAVENAPIDTVRRLANHEDITVAGPILAHSSRLENQDLLEIAKHKSQAHLLAISGRSNLDESVTDVLTARGNNEVFHRLADNSGARFSEAGMTALANRAETDETLAEFLGRRIDIPIELFRKLLLQATEVVRSRLMAVIQPERRSVLRLLLAKISKSAQETVNRDYTAAQHTVQSMKRAHKLNESALLLFAISSQFEHAVVALSVLSAAQFELIDHLMHGDKIDALLVPCKAAGLEWATVRAFLKMKFAEHAIAEHDLEQTKIEYGKLSISAAARVLRFWQLHEKTSGSAGRQ